MRVLERNLISAAPRRIRDRADLATAVEVLREIDPDLSRIIDVLPEVPLRLRPPGFQGLAEIVVAQQVSRASASAMFSRLIKLIDPLDANTVLNAGQRPLVEAGLSRAKQATLTAVAHAIASADLDLESLCELPVEQARNDLTNIKGIGPWTADVFLLFCAGHADIFPAGDVALQHAVGDVAKLLHKPDQKAAAEFAERWAPLRGVAARVLYARYAQMKSMRDLPV